jgi:hypothetical protein
LDQLQSAAAEVLVPLDFQKLVEAAAVVTERQETVMDDWVPQDYNLQVHPEDLVIKAVMAGLAPMEVAVAAPVAQGATILAALLALEYLAARDCSTA